jgi:hypothetical protein
MTWKKLPIENYLLKEMIISGNGKDCELTIRTKDQVGEVSFAMRDPHLVVDIEGNIITETFNCGDSDLGLKYLPSEEIVIELAEIDFPGDEDEWIESLNRFKEGDYEFIEWMIYYAKIKLTKSKQL